METHTIIGIEEEKLPKASLLILNKAPYAELFVSVALGKLKSGATFDNKPSLSKEKILEILSKQDQVVAAKVAAI